MSNEAFLGTWGQWLCGLKAFVPRFRLSGEWICLLTALCVFNWYAITSPTYPGASPHNWYARFRNLNRISIAYAFRPRLRDRLTLRRST